MTPACRMPPPNSFRTRRASAMKSFEPETALPTGALRPFEKHVMTESKPAASDASVTPSAAAAFHSRAPSRCTLSPCCFARARSGSVASRGVTAPAGAVVRVLEREDGRARQVVDGVRRGSTRRPAPASSRPRGPLDRPRQQARQRRHARHLVVEDVALRLEDDLGAGARVDVQRELVAHGARRDEERSLVPEDLGGLLLEAVDGRILAVDVVADLGLGHGAGACAAWVS